MLSSPVLLNIYYVCFSDFWHCQHHPYILQHVNENVFLYTPLQIQCFCMYASLTPFAARGHVIQT